MRIRSILPDFYRSEDVAAMDWHTRLVFIGLWSYVDDNGVGRDNEKLVTADLFPLDGDSTESLRRVSEALNALSKRGQIRRYIHDGQRLLYVVSWDKYQRVQNPGKARYPRPTSEDADSPESVERVSGDSPESLSPGEGEKGRRGEGEETTTSSGRAGRASTPPAGFDDFWDAYPRKDSKRPAVTAYTRALKRADPTRILQGARRYRDDPNRDAAFTALPTTWLNQDRWDDGPLPPRHGNGRTTDRQADILRAEMQRARAADANGRQPTRQIGARP